MVREEGPEVRRRRTCSKGLGMEGDMWPKFGVGERHGAVVRSWRLRRAWVRGLGLLRYKRQ